jgi:hypothetical protein
MSDFVDKVKNFLNPKKVIIPPVSSAKVEAAKIVLAEYREKRLEEYADEKFKAEISNEMKKIDEELKRASMSKGEKVAEANAKIANAVSKAISPIKKIIVGQPADPSKPKTTMAEKMKKIEDFNKNINSFTDALIGNNNSKPMDFNQMLGQPSQHATQSNNNDIFANIMAHEGQIKTRNPVNPSIKKKKHKRRH